MKATTNANTKTAEVPEWTRPPAPTKAFDWFRLQGPAMHSELTDTVKAKAEELINWMDRLEQQRREIDAMKAGFDHADLNTDAKELLNKSNKIRTAVIEALQGELSYRRKLEAFWPTAASGSRTRADNLREKLTGEKSRIREGLEDLGFAISDTPDVRKAEIGPNVIARHPAIFELEARLTNATRTSRSLHNGGEAGSANRANIARLEKAIRDLFRSF